MTQALGTRGSNRYLHILHEKGIKFKHSGNEVYYTNSIMLLVENVLCSKLHFIARKFYFNSLFI
jgi:hypothetical protein